MNTPINTPYELQDYISENIRRKLEELFKDQTVEVKTYIFTNHKSISISISIGTKFYEISETVASGFETYCSEEELTEEECEEAYKKAYKEELEEINKEHTIPIEGKITMKLDDDSEAEIQIYPLECDGDYCIAGLGMHIYVKIPSLDYLEQKKDTIINTTTKFIDSIYDLYTSL
jgi:hypothetical protein